MINFKLLFTLLNLKVKILIQFHIFNKSIEKNKDLIETKILNNINAKANIFWQRVFSRSQHSQGVHINTH